MIGWEGVEQVARRLYGFVHDGSESAPRGMLEGGRDDRGSRCVIAGELGSLLSLLAGDFVL